MGSEEAKIPAHLAMVAARSQFLRNRIRQAREARDKHLEKVSEKISKFVICVQRAPPAAAGCTFLVTPLHPAKSLMWHPVLDITH